MQLHHTFYGEEGQPMIILHGLLGSSGNWHTLASRYFSKSFRVVTVDQRNHGRSPHNDRFDFQVLAEDIEQFIEEHQLAPAHLLGHSMGGKTAMEVALRHPELVDRLVVVDIAPREYPPQHTEIIAALRELHPERYENRQEIDEALSERIASDPVRQFLLKNLIFDGDTSTYRWQMNLEAIERNYDQINVAIDGSNSFEGPALFVRGEKSGYIRDADWDRILKLFPNAKLETIPGAGHWVHADAPRPFATAVLKFLTI